MLTDIFASPGASLLILIVQGLFAWALWSLRRAFVRNDDYLLHLQREARRESVTARRLSALEEHLRQMPAGDDLADLHGELAALRGEIQALNARITATGFWAAGYTPPPTNGTGISIICASPWARLCTRGGIMPCPRISTPG